MHITIYIHITYIYICIVYIYITHNITHNITHICTQTSKIFHPSDKTRHSQFFHIMKNPVNASLPPFKNTTSTVVNHARCMDLKKKKSKYVNTDKEVTLKKKEVFGTLETDA